MIDGIFWVMVAAQAIGTPSIELWFALLGAIFGGAGVRAIEKWLSRSETRSALESSLRTELRDDLHNLREENERLRRERNEWQVRYWEQYELRLIEEDRHRDEGYNENQDET